MLPKQNVCIILIWMINKTQGSIEQYCNQYQILDIDQYKINTHTRANEFIMFYTHVFYLLISLSPPPSFISVMDVTMIVATTNRFDG